MVSSAPASPRVFASPTELAQAVGEMLGHSAWVTIDQDMIDRFAEATGDFQWIHVDRLRARASPFGSTIAHGYLVLSLAPQLVDQIYKVDGVRMRINYGLDTLRFTEPVKSGSRVRLSLKLLTAEPGPKGVRVTAAAVFEIEGKQRPAAVATIISLLIPEN